MATNRMLLKRILDEYNDINHNDYGLTASMNEDDPTKWQVLFFGPNDTGYENGIYKLKHFGIKRGIAYFQAYKPKTKNVQPLFTIYVEDVYAISVFYKDGRPPHKEYNVTNINWAKINAQRDNAAGINIYNLKEKKFVETIRF